MAQLIKLRDCISRYETNPYHYPTQFIRLKQENWRMLNKAWHQENEEEVLENHDREEEAEKDRFRWNPFRKNKRQAEEKVIFKRNLPRSKDQLRQYFLNKLYPFQLKWATSTLTQVSYTEKDYFFDQDLKFLLQHFPDIYFVMYYPIFNVKRAPIDVDILMISPVEIEIIRIIHRDPDEIITVTDERSWTVQGRRREEKILSPVIGLKRSERIIESILQANKLSYRIRKTVISRDAALVYLTKPYNVTLVGPENYEAWYDEKRHLSSSLKGEQLKVMETLLNHCLTNSVRRPEWEREDDDTSFLLGE